MSDPLSVQDLTRAESPSFMTPRSRRNNRMLSASGIESILIESFSPGFPENLSDPKKQCW